MIFIQEIAFSNQESCRLHSIFNFTYKLLQFPNWFEFSLLTGAYSCLRVVLTFARQLSFFIVTIYIPCFMIVIVSWMSFWIDHKAVSWLHTKNVLLANSNAVVHTRASSRLSTCPESRFTHPSCFAFVQRFLLVCPWASPPCLPCPPLKHPSTAPCRPWRTQRPLTCGVVSVSLLSSEPCSNMHSLITPQGTFS